MTRTDLITRIVASQESQRASILQCIDRRGSNTMEDPASTSSDATIALPPDLARAETSILGAIATRHRHLQVAANTSAKAPE